MVKKVTEIYLDNCSEEYKQYIRSARYGDIVERVTKESVTVQYNKKTFNIKFILDFSFDFENSFNYARFSHYEFSKQLTDDLKTIITDYIEDNFITSDRLSM